jgi:ADP-ribose pyrophosphatase YjhB (NUDIX family)
MEANPLPWLRWVRTLQTIGQAGLTWTEDAYDRDRFREVQRVAAEIAAGIAGLPTQAIADAFAADTGHPTPKVDVRGGVLRRDGQILLVRERVDGLWTLPGGWADPGDTPSVTIAREVREESGYAVIATRLVAVHERDVRNPIPLAHAAYKLFFLCELLEDEPLSAEPAPAVGRPRRPRTARSRRSTPRRPNRPNRVRLAHEPRRCGVDP